MAKEYYIVDAEQMKTVNTYVPISEKMKYAEYVSQRCCVPLEISAKNSSHTIDLPPMYKEDVGKKKRYMMGALVAWYLLGKFDSEDDSDKALMNNVDYDKWAGGHILNQIERFKRNKDEIVSMNAFDLRSDYNELEKIVNTECYSLIQALNDPVSRQLAGMANSMTPEVMKETLENLKNSQQAVEDYVKSKKQGE